MQCEFASWSSYIIHNQASSCCLHVYTTSGYLVTHACMHICIVLGGTQVDLYIVRSYTATLLSSHAVVIIESIQVLFSICCLHNIPLWNMSVVKHACARAFICSTHLSMQPCAHAVVIIEPKFLSALCTLFFKMILPSTSNQSQHTESTKNAKLSDSWKGF